MAGNGMVEGQLAEMEECSLRAASSAPAALLTPADASQTASVETGLSSPARHNAHCCAAAVVPPQVSLTEDVLLKYDVRPDPIGQGGKPHSA